MDGIFRRRWNSDTLVVDTTDQNCLQPGTRQRRNGICLQRKREVSNSPGKVRRLIAGHERKRRNSSIPQRHARNLSAINVLATFVPSSVLCATVTVICWGRIFNPNRLLNCQKAMAGTEGWALGTLDDL
jgi:hypothetical protein